MKEQPLHLILMINDQIIKRIQRMVQTYGKDDLSFVFMLIPPPRDKISLSQDLLFCH